MNLNEEKKHFVNRIKNLVPMDITPETDTQLALDSSMLITDESDISDIELYSREYINKLHHKRIRTLAGVNEYFAPEYFPPGGEIFAEYFPPYRIFLPPPLLLIMTTL